jgi:hypothetical protein
MDRHTTVTNTTTCLVMPDLIGHLTINDFAVYNYEIPAFAGMTCS